MEHDELIKCLRAGGKVIGRIGGTGFYAEVSYDGQFNWVSDYSGHVTFEEEVQMRYQCDVMKFEYKID